MKILFTFLTLILMFSHGYAGQVISKGAVNGGGGNITGPDRVPPTEVESILSEEAGKTLRAWLHFKEARLKTALSMVTEEAREEILPNYAFFSQLFDAPNNIHQVVMDLKIEVEMSRPCHDIFGNPRDGSIHSRTPGQICISADQISKKVHRHLVHEEVAALVFHEATHLAGIDEESVVEILQKQMVEDLQDKPEDLFTWESHYTEKIKYSEIRLLERWIHRQEAVELPAFKKFKSDFFQMNLHLGGLILNRATQALDARTFSLMEAEWVRLEILEIFLKQDLRKLDEIFQGDKVISAALYYERLYGIPRNEPEMRSVLITRPHSVGSVIQHLEQTKRFYKLLKNSIQDFLSFRMSVTTYQ